MHRLLLEPPEQLETPRLLLRRYQPGDGVWYFPMSLRNQPHLAQYEADNPLMRVQNETDAEIIVRDFAAAWVARTTFLFAVFLRQSQQFVAQIYIGSLNWELPEFMLGYFADCDHEGHGFVTEASQASLGFIFEHLGAQRVRLECDDGNLRSQRVAERCGLLREGHLREVRRWPDGSLSGTLIYGMLRSEFLAQTRPAAAGV